MRAGVLLALLALASVAAPQEGDRPEPSPYAAMGFPVMFNGDIITANDVARFLEMPLEDIDPRTLKSTRDILIFRKINERIAADLGIEVGDQDVDQQIAREVSARGGDAKFYEWLAQQGTTLERYRLERREWFIEQLIKILLQSGVSYDRAKLLPWRVAATPKDVETAFRSDPVRREGALRARRLFFTVDVDRADRNLLAGKVARGMSAEEVQAELAAKVRPKVEEALAALKQRPFADVARDYGVKDVEAMTKEWIVLHGANDIEKFLATAEVGAWSSAIPLPGGACEIVQLLERDNPASRKPSDPAVADEYSKRIRSLRATKCEALLRRRALDESTVEPERVRDEVRTQILDSLREAEEGLRALGLR